jgi:hypothetical protein
MEQVPLTVELLSIGRLRQGVYAVQYRVGDLPGVAQELDAEDTRAAWKRFQDFAAAKNWAFKANDLFDKLTTGEFDEQ